jgi:radical SAM-linked protein
MRCFERLLRRAGLALSFSQGFHPKPRMTFPLALAVGIEGLDEVMELELAEELSAGELLERIAPQVPTGLKFHSAEVLPEGSRKAQIQAASYEVPIPEAFQPGLDRRVERLRAAASWPIERSRGRGPLDLRPLLLELGWSQGLLRMRLRVDRRGSAGPRDVLRALELGEVERHGARLRRTAVEVCA